MTLLIPIALAAYAVLAWYRPRIALGVLLALLPAYLVRFSVLGIPMTALEGMALVLAVAVLGFGRGTQSTPPPLAPPPPEYAERGGIRKELSPFADRMVVLAAAWVFIGMLAAMWSDAGVAAWGIWKAYIVEPVLLYVVVRALAQADGGMSPFLPRKHIVLPLLVGAAGVAAMAVWQHWTGYGIPHPWQDAAVRRVTSIFGYPNAVGLYLAPLVPLAFGMVGVSWRRGKTPPPTPPLEAGEGRMMQTMLVLCFLFVVGLGAIAAAYFTRGAGTMVAIAAGIAALVVCAAGKRFLARHARGASLAIVTVWVVVCLVVTAWLPHQPERARTGSAAWQKLTFQQWSGSVRLSQYREFWQLLADHPIRGAGLAGYPIAIQPYKEKQNVETFQYPHNLFLAVLSELGLPGLIVFLAIVGTFFVRAFTVGASAAISAAMIAVLVFGLVDIPVFKNDLAVQFWMLLALGTVSFQGLAQSRETR